ncbi:uncharacterized protein BDFB_002027 [Asbolus verrucosus]|uniref:Uncharacterized protein n=1 Tax=Asbolus verrucosus TaxID=1661398 RepID=A0A482W895_ASBVE|nr:uncharacterized protein BDFB_002027 [Asbolus verrucosus]
MAKIFNAFIIAVLIYSITCTDTNVCVQKSPCLCEFSEYSRIDISQATQKDQNPIKPEDFLQDEINGDIFYFHGCTDGIFNLTAHKLNSTNNATILKGSLIYQSQGHAKVLGESSQIKFHTGPDEKGAYDLTYKGVNGSVLASIHLICDSFNQPFIKVLPNTSNEQILVLSSPHACIITQHPGLSTGSVLLILFFIAVGIYFICGGIVLYFIRGARGLELIPNIDFWRGLPGLVKWLQRKFD